MGRSLRKERKEKRSNMGARRVVPKGGNQRKDQS